MIVEGGVGSIPVVGTVIGIYEAYEVVSDANSSGKDRVIAIVGVIPGGKLVKILARVGGDEIAAVVAKGKGNDSAGTGTGVGSPSAGKPVDSTTRDRIKTRDQKPDGSWECATCGQSTKNPANVHTGHIVPRSKGGDLSDGNLRCEGAACNLSQGNRDAPKPGMTCKERGSCGAPYGRSD
jgi:hypothetical protein